MPGNWEGTWVTPPHHIHTLTICTTQLYHFIRDNKHIKGQGRGGRKEDQRLGWR